jgi:hypothetical protein
MLTAEQKQQWSIKCKYDIRNHLFNLGHTFDSQINMHIDMKSKSVNKVHAPVTKVRPSVHAQPTPPSPSSPSGSPMGTYPTSNMAPTPGGPGGNYPPGQVVPISSTMPSSSSKQPTPQVATKTRPTKPNTAHKVAKVVRSKNPQV